MTEQGDILLRQDRIHPSTSDKEVFHEHNGTTQRNGQHKSGVTIHQIENSMLSIVSKFVNNSMTKRRSLSHDE